MTHRERLAGLERLLLAHAYVWRPQPFKLDTPDWCARHPGLADALLALDDAALDRLAGNDLALVRLLAEHVPAAMELAALIDLPALPAASCCETPPRFDRDIPGRKWAQIRAYAAALRPQEAPVLEWCAGKGHLGRLLAQSWRVPVTSLELSAELCAAGHSLAGQARLRDRQDFLQLDALTPEARHQLAGRHAVALHACGDLHRALVAGGVGQQVPALDLAPCCYYRTAHETYRPFRASALRLDHDDLRLAVTDTVTAPPRQRQRTRQATAWKLAYQALARQLTGAPYRPLKPTPEAWMQAGFAAWCQRVAAREGLALSFVPDWADLESLGWRRAARVRRLELARLAFRRALEVWLVTDMAAYLEDNGYRVSLGIFCPRHLTPRNLLLSARR
ncbi:MAG: SAM-dependent methyltransferase [Thiobacillaceae bacterium]|jgi:hypothetical protein|nr:SAM-dependent methyltransferase [Thiobacillaceae bacterium]